MSFISGPIAANKAEDASNASADKQQQSANYAVDMQMKMYEKALEEYKPFADLGKRNIDYYEGLSKESSPAVPTWNPTNDPEVEAPDYDTLMANMTESPTYTWKKDRAEKALGRSLASRGKYFSGNAVSESYSDLNNKLLSDEVALGQQRYQAKLGEYSIDNAARDNRYSRSMDTYKARLGEYGLGRDASNTKYDRALDLVKIGANAAGSAGAASTTTGNSIGNIYSSLGQGLGAATLTGGMAQAKLWSGLGAQSGNAASSTYSIYKLGQGLGWWGTGATGAATAAGAGATSGAAIDGYAAYFI